MIEILVESSSARQSLNTHAVFALGVTSEFPSPALVLVFCCCRGGGYSYVCHLALGMTGSFCPKELLLSFVHI